MFLNHSQRAAFDQLIDFGLTKFSPPHVEGLDIRPRILPLLHGPTGCGKTFLAETVAKELRAKFMKAAISSWIPVGARDASAYTLDALKLRLLEDSRLVFLIDEIDKLATDTGSWKPCGSGRAVVHPRLRAFHRRTADHRGRNLAG